MISLNLRHPLGKATTLLLFLFSAILWTSCDKEQALSKENLIVRLSLKDGDKEYVAKVSSGTLSVELPSGSTLPTEVTISLLELSLKARASASLNSKLTLAAGRATITVTAENKATKEYTLIVTVKKNAAADLKSLIVSIGSKSYTATLSNSQASVLLPATVDIPAFVTVASLEVSDLARASVVVGGRIDLTNGTASIVVTAEDGTTTRSYTLKVSKEEANQANLFALSIRFGQTVYQATIVGDVATFSGVSRSMTSGTITAINISEGARSSATVDDALSFTDGEGRLIVTANGGQTSKTITVKLEGAALSTEAELSALSLTIGGVTYVATVSGTVATVLTPQAVTSASVASLSYAAGATSSVEQGGVLTFAGGVSTITITAADGKTTKVYQIVLAKEGDLLTSFSFQVAGNSYTSPYTAFTTSLGRIDQTAGTIEVELSPYLRGVELASLVPSFTTIGGATVVVGTAAQESGKTPNDFSGGVVTYTVSLAGTSKQYTVNVGLSNLAWIPDANFRAKLKDVQSLAGAFTQNDSLITDHSSVTGLGFIVFASSSISSMTGLEFFTGLTYLDCSKNSLTDLDVSKNIALTILNCSFNQLTSLDVSKNTALTRIYCLSNDLTSLDVSKSIALANLYCSSNDLTDLDVSQNIALTTLHCDSNQLTDLDVSQNIALTLFRCNNNRLTTLDVRAQQSWADLRINAGETANDVLQNPLTTLHVHEAAKDNAEVLEAKQNLRGALTISTYNTEGDVVCGDYDPIGQICTDGIFLKSFSIDLASNNLVTSHTGRTSLVGQIDDESATKTVTVFVSPYEKNVDLTSLKASFEVKSGATVTVGGVAQTSGVTPNDFSAPVTYSVSSGTATQEYTISVKTTNLAWIPDPKFRAKLKTLSLALAFTQNDSLITDHSSVKGLTSMVRLGTSGITSMTGLEFFTGLTSLDCSKNSLTDLDVTKNIALTQLNCSSNDLTSLDVSQNTALTSLSCHSNDLTDLDVSKNTALTFLSCYSNDLTDLDVSENIGMNILYCNSNQLTNLDLRVQQAWPTLSINAGETADDVVQNPLTTLHVHEAVKDHAEFIEAKTNRGDALTISTYSTAGGVVCEDYDPIGQICTDGILLTSFSIDLASNNLVTTHTGRTRLVGRIDYESDPKTVTVFVSPYEKNVDLTSLKASFKVKSGATVTVGGVAQSSGVTPNSFSAPVTYSVSSGGTTQQYTVSVKTTNLAWIPDPNFRAKLKTLSLAGAFTQNDSLITDHTSVTALSEMRVESSNIDSMMGLEFFTGLTTLNCSSNQLRSLDVSKNTGLTDLYCNDNLLTSLDISKNIGLTELYCYSNELTALGVSKNIGLTTLACNSNQLTDLDVSQNTGLIEFNCSSNQLTDLDLRSHQSWRTLIINAGVTENDVVQNPLTTLHVHEAVKDHAEVLEAKTNRGDALTISTYTTAGNVVCEDYDPIGQICTDGIFLTSFSIDLASNTIVTTHTGRISLVGQIDDESDPKTVTVFVSPYEKNVDFTSLKASFEVKSGATVTVGGVAQTSGVTPNNFSAPVTYSISSGSTTQEYTVSVKTTNLAWIPDPNFRAKLKTLPLAGAFTQNDSLITDHGSVTGLSEMRVESSNIDSMMGLEFFIGLTNLKCYSNDLTNLDVSKNIALTFVSCSSNELTDLDVSKNIVLRELNCFSNQLTVLDVRAQQSLIFLGINAGAIIDGVVKNPLTTLHIHEAVKDHAEVIEAKTNRGDALTISTYNTAGDVVCNNYDPRATSRGCKD